MAKSTQNTVQKISLAAILVDIVKEGDAMDSTASKILTAIRQAKAVMLEEFDKMLEAAYTENGWQKGGGRPKIGASTVTVPEVVRTYASEIRAAYRLELDVLTFDNIKTLRNAVREKRRKLLGAPESEERVEKPHLAGLTVRGEDRLNGGLFHDLIVVHDVLPDAEKAKFEASLERLLKKFFKPVQEKLTIPPRAIQKAAERGATLH